MSSGRLIGRRINDAVPPTPDQVKNGQDSTGTPLASNLKGSISLTANTEASAVISELAPATDYDIYFIAKDASNNLQAAVSKVDVTTADTSSVPVVLPTGVTFTDTDLKIGQVGGDITWTLADPETGIIKYAVYFLDTGSSKVGTVIGEVYAGTSTFTIPADTTIPTGATQLGIYSENAGGESASAAVAAITDSIAGSATLYITDAEVTSKGHVNMTFNKQIFNPNSPASSTPFPDGTEDHFTVTVDGKNAALAGVESTNTPGRIKLVLNSALSPGSYRITISYDKSGDTSTQIKATDDEVLESFTNYQFSN